MVKKNIGSLLFFDTESILLSIGKYCQWKGVEVKGTVWQAWYFLGLPFYIFDYCIACFVKILKFCHYLGRHDCSAYLSIRGNEIFFASWVPVSISFFAKYVMMSFYVIRRNVRVRRPQSIQSAGFPSSRPNWVPHPLTCIGNCSYPFWVQGGRHTRLGEGWGTQFRWRDRHSGTLCIL
jgi:hypothetical protein